MVGGIIREIVQVSPERWWVDCVDPVYPGSTCAIYLHPGGNDLQVGDKLWWQAGWAMWTPWLRGQCVVDTARGRVDTRLDRIGYSGVERPVTA